MYICTPGINGSIIVEFETMEKRKDTALTCVNKARRKDGRKEGRRKTRVKEPLTGSYWDSNTQIFPTINGDRIMLC